ncbi:beta-ketoacyl synthase N-terminal-like domain-containing protein [Streptomyces purpurogeneiscleroticus]|uniref:beta-ketoacyl synthase N-terminal-like domain-containing protein n=1 Tax=Streptomyces purpurogeneiscleroticus TaxID=68259 RepID=UPI001CBBD617|nr:type I polyketide synthase [Streptomyces purpurogeneiscleroticus]
MTSTESPAEGADFRGRLTQALRTVSQLRSALEEHERAAHEPVAVVGLSVRLPGEADTADRFWELLQQGVDAISPFPSERGDTVPYRAEAPGTPGKAYVTEAGYVRTTEYFDAQVFGISPPEALGMDPQQRMVLEGAWEALEHAGIAPDSLNGTRSGVFVGASTSDYVRMRQQFGTADGIDSYQLFGESSFIAGRVAHTLGLRGPAQVIDTACSSSLMAVHQAIRGLRSGEIDLALAGGVNAILSPYGFVLLSQSRAVAPDGRCKTFDAAADGYARGEGCGVLVLKRLSDALAHSDRILGVLRGSAANHDGRASGISVPSGPAQQEVIRAALADAGVRGTDIGYVEAHGTGTVLGDPIELRSLEAVLGAQREADRPLYVGSVKTNIGHLEAGAGVAGLIKALLVVARGEIPPHLHFHTPNPMVEWDRMHLRIPTRTVPWPEEGRARLAGVSSFGASGTNVHVVLEGPLASPAPAVAAPAVDETQLLAASARSPEALRATARRYAEHLESLAQQEPGAGAGLRNFCLSAHTGRAHQPHRLAVVADSPAAMAQQLRAFADGRPGAAVSGKASPRYRPKVAFLFTGQGAQYPGMAAGLYAADPVFRDALDRCAEGLRAHLDRPLLQVLFAEEGTAEAGLLDRTAWTQPALFAVEYALAQTWLSRGVRPTACLGHSVGEITAACVAGALTLKDALALVAARGRAMDDLPAGGAMLAVPLTEEAAHVAIGPRTDRVGIAAVNGPESVVLSGAGEAIEQIERELRTQGVKSRRLRVSHAFHSPLMAPALPELARLTASVTVSEPAFPLLSGLTGAPVDLDTLRDAEYWCRHARQAVRFHDGLLWLKNAGIGTFVEVGPGRTLLGMGTRALPDHDLQWLPSLRRGSAETTELQQSLGRLYVSGAPVVWQRQEDPPWQRVEVPAYPFQRRRYVFPAEAPAGGPLPGRSGPAAAPGVYAVTWREAALSREPMTPAPGRTLLLADTTGVAEELAHKLRAAGEECLLRYAPGTEPGEARHTVRPDAVGNLVAEEGPFDRVVHLWSLDAPTAEDAGGEDIAAARQRGPEMLLGLAQSLLKAGSAEGSRPCRLWVITHGAVATQEEEKVDCVAAAAAAGFGKSLVLEHPELWGGSVDLSGGGAELDALRDELLLNSGAEDQVALRGARRLVPRVVPRTDAPVSATPTIRPEACYLLVGGLGGVGLTVADWLAGLGVRRLVLTSRTGLPPREEWEEPHLPPAVCDRITAVRALEEQGVTVRVEAADVCDTEVMRALVDQLRTAPGGLAGVVHAAGLSSGEDIVQADAAAFREVLRPKMDGAWTLHHVLEGVPIDFLALMSSVTAVWGAPHLAAYTTANHFLDALAAYRRTRGLPASVVNWGRWDGVSGLGGRGRAERVAATGYRPMDAEGAMAHLGALLAGGEGRRIVAEVDWEVVRPLLESQRARPLLAEMAADRTSSAAAQEADDGVALQRVLSLPSGEREQWLEEYVWQCLAEQLGVDLAEFTGDFDLLDFGYDSLGAMRTLTRFRRELKLELAAREFFEISADEWGRFLAESVAAQHE